MDDTRKYDEAALKRISVKVRQRLSRKFGLKAEVFFFNNIEIITELFRATFVAIREENERPK